MSSIWVMAVGLSNSLRGNQSQRHVKEKIDNTPPTPNEGRMKSLCREKGESSREVAAPLEKRKNQKKEGGERRCSTL